MHIVALRMLSIQLILRSLLLLGRTCIAFPTSDRSAQDSPPARLDSAQSGRKLQGKFLHITDVHPDPFYKTYSSTEKGAACHRGSGPAGIYGAETSGCDSPISLVNETFKWIDEHLKDSIDFVVWTGDSARHDNDEAIPRSEAQVVGQNELLVSKFVEVFGNKGENGNDTDPMSGLVVPIVPTFGNNDILPHNIFAAGPNRWTKMYLDIWKRFIPEEQRHQFQRDGWFYVEVIPGRLAVFSLNTLYFFNSNSAVDGCAARSEPGYEQMDWLRVQLQLLRERGMKAILTGHVPPARTKNKKNWDETCWQKYTLWLRQYRDVIVGSLFGHMNIDHFMLQDSRDINIDVLEGDMYRTAAENHGEDDISIAAAGDYLIGLRDIWARLPRPPKSMLHSQDKDESSIWDRILSFARGKLEKDTGASNKQRYLGKIGGQYGERYSISLVQASVIPNYFPTLRVIHYNITGLEDLRMSPSSGIASSDLSSQLPLLQNMEDENDHQASDDAFVEIFDPENYNESRHKKQKGGRSRKDKKKKKKSKKYKFIVPDPPAKTAPPGPAYSPQTLTWLGYTQHYANLTEINNDFHDEDPEESFSQDMDQRPVDQQKWKEGKHRGKKPHKGKSHKPHPKQFHFDVEYDTFSDKVFRLKDLTIRSYVDLAMRIGSFKGEKEDKEDLEEEHANTVTADEDEGKTSDPADNDSLEARARKGKGGKKKHKKRKAVNKVWYTFVERALVKTLDKDEIREQFGERAVAHASDDDVGAMEL